jgi:hypothetical protein
MPLPLPSTPSFRNCSNATKGSRLVDLDKQRAAKRCWNGAASPASA